MKLYKMLIALVLVCSTQVATAQVYTENCSYDACCEQDGCCSNYDFSVYGDFLWWKVCRSELNFSSNGTTHYASPKYDSGYRLGGSVSCKCLDLGLRYTSYQTSINRKDPENTSSESVDHFKYNFDYDVVDLELGFNFNVDCACGTVRPFAGVKFADISDKIDDDFNSDHFKYKYNGTGLYVGAEGSFNVYTWQSCDCCWNVPVNLVARASTGILDGEFKHHEDNESGGRKNECIFVPVHELSIAAEFELNGLTSCLNPKLRLGYEIQSWGPWRELNSSTDLASLGLGGMVLGLEADF